MRHGLALRAHREEGRGRDGDDGGQQMHTDAETCTYRHTQMRQHINTNIHTTNKEQETGMQTDGTASTMRRAVKHQDQAMLARLGFELERFLVQYVHAGQYHRTEQQDEDKKRSTPCRRAAQPC